MSSLNDLLLSVLDIHKRYLSTRTNKWNKDEFNVFSVLRVEYKEIRHSAFLAELLNPKGSHKMGDKFLRLFYQKLGLNDVEDFSSTVVGREFVTGIGNIDIYIKAEKPENSIIIENKIYADDQDGQLARYHTFDPQARLVYLTLDGHYASEKSLSYKKAKCFLTEDDYDRISYIDFIIDWIEQCCTLVTNNPYVKETLGQYIDLLKKITRNILNQDERMEIAKEVVKDNDSVQSFLLMVQNSSEIYEQLSILIWNEMLNVADKLHLGHLLMHVFKNDKNGNSLLSKNTLLYKKWTYVVFDLGSTYCPVIGFEKENFTDIWFGIAGKDGTRKNISKKNIDTIRERFEAAFDKPLPGATPIVHLWWDEHRNLLEEKFSCVFDGSFAVDLEALLQRLMKVIQTV